MMRKIAVFTGTRAEYGLLYWLLKDIQADTGLCLQLLVTGMHLSPEFGNTYTQIEADGFEIDEKVEILLSSDTPVGIAKSMGLGVLGFTDALERLKPDCLIVLGDRFEALAIAQVAMVMRIPIVHLHGGEITEGAYDDSFRHAITKLSHLHFTSTEEYRKRVIQLGEDPKTVFNVGAIGLDHLKRSSLLKLNELSDSLSFELNKPYFVVTYHPVTLADEDPEISFLALLSALDEFKDYQVIITYPNADDGGRKIIPLLENYGKQQSSRVLTIPSLGQKRYLSAIKHAEVVIGNSSSGIIEVPSFNVPTVNIGARQKGRLAANSVFHCDTKKNDIYECIKSAIAYKNEKTDKEIANPYGDGNTSGKILNILKSHVLNRVKIFHNL
ncbi:UDP-N-acetylglucosamine 2-epimerase [Brenneria corticis]|uniref:UDP-N-acetylglucosamine 2-epimerase (Hydrolyzing) n=1 Tax=Brenneria corticis TaxID=2173106 RepID=A0A2U1TJY0_9GAMM|nr:UDP-N-acetylglucosamine 2-epimerase [Brenneria sp. CFCC 11842]PWC09731.1 UDP-N-acetylglucosamine 2-epimerase (hydrolyzing) [Brenneria sp. CFCC 11842]